MTIQRQLKGLFCLDHNIRLYIPTTINISEKADTATYLDKALHLFSRLFGGSTSYDAKGSWVSNQNLVIESVQIVESYATKEQVARGLEEVIRFAHKIKTELKQEAVSLEYDNKLYFI